MSSRLIRVKDTGGHGQASSRKGFYRWIDRGYTWMLSFAMRHRIAVVGRLDPCDLFRCVPLYRSVKQEFIPSNVDEAEFEVNINGPEGTNMQVMNAAMLEIEKQIMATHGVRLVLSSAGGSFIGGLNSGGAYVRIAPHEERTLSLTRIWTELKKGNPGRRSAATTRNKT